ncbi:MAG TPA: calcium/sodium antiporter [Phycisphaerae bacterium]|nr:calcium/sodium antiporter [Phycisphaerae bacterium]
MVGNLLYLIVGAALLYAGAELLVRGASGLAKRLGISPLVIGLTVVAFGTSAPELVVAITAALQGKSDLLVGNVIGSNIMNIAIIVGLSAAARAIALQRSTIRREMPIALGAAALAWLFGLDGTVTRLDATVLLLGFCGFVWYCWRLGRKGGMPVAEVELTGPWLKLAVSLPAILAGGVGLRYGADFLVQGAEAIALTLGASETLVGLTVVAVGTSLPELATSVVAAARGQPDISIGNVVGSNVFNSLLVLGAAGLVHPAAFNFRARWIDGPVMVGFSVVLVGMMITGRRVSRTEGVALLAGYAIYLATLLAWPAPNG